MSTMPPSMSVPHATSVQPLPLKGEDNGATCVICGLYLRRNTDLPRHMLIHSKDKQSLMFTCPMDGCGHQTLQKSNLATHIRTHTRAKPHKCPEYFSNGHKCDFSTADPSSLHRHRKRKHGYTPRPKPTSPPIGYSPPQPYLPRRDSGDADLDAEGDIDAEGEPVSECESEESLGFPAGGSKVAALLHSGGELGGEPDGEGEPEDESEPIPLVIVNVSAERMDPSPTLDSAMPAPPPVPVLANISDTRTDVDAQ
ncbi:hypothetical protein C8R43DRAFT_1024248 [Mycena crocata]|nr:hypothetical protein C8R43DRAFT_1024248 [Mycena crocata]